MRGSTGRGGHRRHRSRRGSALRAVLVCLALLFLCGLAITLVISVHRNAQPPDDYFADSSPQDAKTRATLALLTSQNYRPRTGRVVYPYSVVPGGVQDPSDLARASTEDRVVSSHFAGFDYRRAQVIRLAQPKEVYLSYRLRDRVYWTSKKIHLGAGEKLITDGKITARTRCANRVSETKQAMVSPEEPPAANFERAMAEDEVPMLHFPSTFDSALLHHPQMPDPGRSSTGLAPLPLLGGWLPAGIAPPPVPLGSCETADQEKHEKGPDNEKKENPCPTAIPGHPSHPPASVPEPGTILLVSSGLTGIYLRYRKNRKTEQ